MASTLTPKTLGLALAALGLALTHAAMGEPTSSTGSKVSTFRPSNSSSGSTINTFNKSGGTAGRGVATVKGEPSRYKSIVLASNTRSKGVKGNTRGKISHEPPVIRVRRVDEGAAVDALIPGVRAMAPAQQPMLFASADTVESPLIAIAQPETEVRSDMLPAATPAQEQVIFADASPIAIPPLPVAGAPVPESVRQEEANKPVVPTITGGALGTPNRRR